METEKLKKRILSLPFAQRERLLKEIEDSVKVKDLSTIASRRHEFDNKPVSVRTARTLSMSDLVLTRAPSATNASPATGVSPSTPALGWPVCKGRTRSPVTSS
tara:strand:- start:3140 stop:3448 length:309 start_codon:yes stop_codon:yes gene_type:complete